MRRAPKGYDITALISEAWLLIRRGDRNGSRTFFECSAAQRGLGKRFLKQNGIIARGD